jgi:hypothetical protein
MSVPLVGVVDTVPAVIVAVVTLRVLNVFWTG